MNDKTELLNRIAEIAMWMRTYAKMARERKAYVEIQSSYSDMIAKTIVEVVELLDRLTAERDGARKELAEARDVIGTLTFNMREQANMLIGLCQTYARFKIAPGIESEASE